MDELIFDRDCLQHDVDATSEAYTALVPQLAEARAWMVNATALLKVVSGYVSHERFPGVAQELLAVAQACPLPKEEEDDDAAV